MATIVVDRADSVNDVFRLELMPTGHLGLSCPATAQKATFHEQPRSGGAMDDAVDAATAEQRFIGRIDDGVDVKLGYVAFDDVHSSIGGGCHGWSLQNGILFINPLRHGFHLEFGMD